MKIEAIFGGALALMVLVFAVIALSTTRFDGTTGPAPDPFGTSVKPTPAVQVSSTNKDSGLCSCYNQAFKLAGSNVGVTSAQYRTGFEQCRAILGVNGGNAWTAGWNARLSARPYEASCRAYRKRAA